MRIQDLRTQLAEMADDMPAARIDPVTAVNRRIRRHRRRARTATAAVVAVAAISAGLLWASRSGQPAHRVATGSVPPPTVSTVLAGSSRDLAGFGWSRLPSAPIAARSGASVAWTGREMVVWGGLVNTQKSQLLSDGAAYNPVTAQWRPIAAAGGVAARWNAITVWTGRDVLVMGGTTPNLSDITSNDGAYNPDLDRWRLLPSRPASLTGTVTGAWTGQQELVISWERSMASYSPGTDQWQSLAPLPEPGDRQLDNVTPVWAGDRLVVWVEWDHTITEGKITSGTWGIDLWDYDPVSDRWTQPAVVQGSERPGGIDSPVWIGDRVILPASGIFRGAGSGPGEMDNRHGLTYSPSTRTYTPMAHGPVDDAATGALWTGKALLRVATGEIRGPQRRVGLGGAAAWDPATNDWTTLSMAPITGYDYQLVWTGHEILTYGPNAHARFGPP